MCGIPLRLTVACGVAVVMYCSSAPAQESPQSHPEKDALYGAVDPFNVFHQRKTFAAAAGIDSQLDEREFLTEKGKKDGEGFTRSFDAWEAMLLFDADKDGMIGWLEAAEYRLTLRSVFIMRFDKNRNLRFEPEERLAVIDALKDANLVQWLRDQDGDAVKEEKSISKSQTNPGDPARPQQTAEEREREIDQEELEYDRRAMEALASEPEAWLSRDDEKRGMASMGVFLLLDQDGDGRVNQKDEILQGRRLRQSRRVDCERELEKVVEKFDLNGNGKLDPEESEILKKERWADAAIWFDKDYHGVVDLKQLGFSEEQILEFEEHPERCYSHLVIRLDEEEQREFEKSHEYRHLQLLEKLDEDGDGVLSDQENEPLYRMESIAAALRSKDPQALQRIYGAYRSEYWWEFDGDGDGKLNENEVVFLNTAFTKETRGKAPITNYPHDPWNDRSHLP